MRTYGREGVTVSGLLRRVERRDIDDLEHDLHAAQDIPGPGGEQLALLTRSWAPRAMASEREP